jgi:hypothetical protein
MTMIINNGWKREAFLRSISLHLTGDARHGADGDGVVYFGAGLWRGIWFEESGIRLINPSESPADIETVEKALCVLHCGKFAVNQ